MHTAFGDALVEVLARLHAWQVSGAWLIGALAVGVFVGGLVVPALQHAAERLHDFSVFCALRDAERARAAEAQQKELESKMVLAQLAQRRPASASASAEPASSRASMVAPPPEERTIELTSLTALSVVEPDELPADEGQTRTFARFASLATRPALRGAAFQGEGGRRLSPRGESR